jgi:hypothetical protein
MGITKQNALQKTKPIGNLAKALGHPARIAIIQHLISEQLCMRDIVNELPLAQPTNI